MGLDVYLYKCENLAEASMVEAQYNAESENIWESVPVPYDQMSEQDKDACRAMVQEIATKLGLDEYGSSPLKQQIELDSPSHPEHMFKIGYFRSSYNGGGINSTLDRMGLPDLYYVFDPQDQYEFVPDWNQALKRIKELIREYKKAIHSELGKYDVFCAEENMFGMPDDVPTEENAALERFSRVLNDHGNGSPFQSFSNIYGEYFMSGIKIYAILHGRKFNAPCVYVIYEKDTDNQDWYLQALEIVKETIEYVLNDPDADQYFLHWSS